jgi:hypothetical protein
LAQLGWVVAEGQEQVRGLYSTYDGRILNMPLVRPAKPEVHSRTTGEKSLFHPQSESLV